MDWTYLFLGILQGATEFLPVSSSGHLFVAERILNGSQSSLSFVLLLHLATLCSVLAVFFKDIKLFALAPQKKRNRQLFFKLLISLIPLLAVGLFLRPFVEKSFNSSAVSLGFLSSGLLLLSLLLAKKGKRPLERLSFFQAFLIGAAQAVAVFPGFSRAAWTITAGLYCGLKPRAAVYFSFLISLPAVAGSALAQLLIILSKNPEILNFWKALSASGWLFALAFISAFVSGFLSLRAVLKLAGIQKLYIFSFYLLPLSLAVFFFLGD